MKNFYFYSIFLFLACVSCGNSDSNKNQNTDTNIVVGGFRFGSSQNEILEIAKSMNFDVIPNGSYHYILKGDIPALGMTWNEMDITYDEKVGIKQIVLTRAYDTVTQAMIDNHFASLVKIFPNIEKTPYNVSISAGDYTMKSNYASIFDIKDDRPNGYSGGTYYILDKNQFSTLICSKVY